ncbi:MAG: glycerol-3-phosphate 1-O-acyltransferase PlsY [Gammaproteobacteria bacterium]|nr:glycerol-3-phosphate 1-O-acyltransferase PlsY [Gammaproteobacteria bacterium]
MEILFLPLAYLIGSLSCAIIVCKLLRLPDPRTEGSRNPGATNVLRISGKKTAAVVLLGDALKGFIPVLLAQHFHFAITWQGFIGLAAMLGHSYPLFFRFEGGKGVATFFGVMLAIAWPLGLMLLAIWYIMAKLFHYSSLAALTVALCAPFLALLFFRPLVVTPIGLMSCLLIYRHKDNIERLITRKESKIGAKS